MKAYIIIPKVLKGIVDVEGYLSFSKLKRSENLDIKKEDLPKEIPGGRVVVKVEINEEL